MPDREKVIEKLQEKYEEGRDITSEDLRNSSVNLRQTAFEEVSKKYSGWYHSTNSLIQKLEISDKKAIEDFEFSGESIEKSLHKSASPQNGQYLFKAIENQVSTLEGILEIYKDIEPIAIKSAVAKGIYETQLDQAEGLLNGDHLIPSAAVARSVLEDSLDKLVEKHSVEPEGSGIEKKAEALWKQGPLSKVEYRQIVRWSDIGNIALHENGKDIDHSDVSEMIESIRDFMEKLEMDIA